MKKNVQNKSFTDNQTDPNQQCSDPVKIAVYSYRSDEEAFFREYANKYGAELVMIKQAPSAQTVELAAGCCCISIITTILHEKLLKQFFDSGVRFISTRTIGYDHIDRSAAKRLGISIGNVNYSPYSIADYTIMLMLMSLRNAKVTLQRYNVQDYSLSGLRGRELHDMTVGVIGTGRIGEALIRQLSGFGCKILANDIAPKESLAGFAEYVTLGRLYTESDIITLHIPSSESNYHLIDASVFSKMKQGAVLINTARGALVDTDALVDAIENGTVAAAGLDVLENESDLYYSDYKAKILFHRDLALLQSYPNVILTPHVAFFTDHAVRDMVAQSVQSCVRFARNASSSFD